MPSRKSREALKVLTLAMALLALVSGPRYADEGRTPGLGSHALH